MTATTRQGADAMGETDETHERTAAWAELLAQRLQHAHDATPATAPRAEEWIPEAVAALWTLWDEAVAQATAALVHAGLSERIVTVRTDHEYRLGMEAVEGDARYIRIFVGLRAVNGHASGGAQITISTTRATIYLVPAMAEGRPRWLIPATGTEFTARLVDDLLLSVFANDPAATRRVGRYVSVEDSS
jgi:hypothetical protein